MEKPEAAEQEATFELDARPESFKNSSGPHGAA
jgi:hypothetical protein